MHLVGKNMTIDKPPETVEGYKVVQKIGSGSYSIVYRAKHLETAGREVAVKVFRKSACIKPHAVANEIAFMKILKHPNILSPISFGISRNLSYFIMDLSVTGSLADYLRVNPPLLEAEAGRYVQQICSALIYLHSRFIIHGDLKPENIIMYDTPPLATVKLSDFGLSNIVSKESSDSSHGGSIYYMSPEMLLKFPYDHTTDYFSLGIIIFHMLFKRSPFPIMQKAAYIANMKKRPAIEWPTENPVSIELRNLVLGFLKFDKGLRPRAPILKMNVYIAPNFVDGIYPEDCFADVAELVTEALETLAARKGPNLAIVNFTMAVQLLKIKYKENDDLRMRSYVAQKITEYTHAINELEKMILGEIGDVKLEGNIGDWEQLRNMAKSTPLMLEALDMGFVGEIFYKERSPYARKNLQDSVDRLMVCLNHEPPGPRKNLVAQKLKTWLGYLEKLKRN